LPFYQIKGEIKMFCPNCSQENSNEATQFCSKCGFNLKGVREIFKNDGAENEISNRQKGIRQGVKLILLSLILFPAFTLLSAMFPPNDVLVESSPSSTWFEQIGWAVLWTTALSGVARILYAVVFEQHSITADEKTEQIKQIKTETAKNALPPQESIPVSDFGKWKTTGDLYEPVFSKPKISGELK